MREPRTPRSGLCPSTQEGPCGQDCPLFFLSFESFACTELPSQKLDSLTSPEAARGIGSAGVGQEPETRRQLLGHMTHKRRGSPSHPACSSHRLQCRHDHSQRTAEQLDLTEQTHLLDPRLWMLRERSKSGPAQQIGPPMGHTDGPPQHSRFPGHERMLGAAPYSLPLQRARDQELECDPDGTAGEGQRGWEGRSYWPAPWSLSKTPRSPWEAAVCSPRRPAPSLPLQSLH